MKQRMRNLVSVLQDSRSRTILFFVFVILIVAMIIGYVKLKKVSHLSGPVSKASVSAAPTISSIPGAGEPSREYVKLQEEQNVALVQEAQKTGHSAIPTLVRTTYLDSGVSAELAAAGGSASSLGCSLGDLQKAKTAGVTAGELRCRGCSVAALKAAGYSAAELKAAGFPAQALKAAGFSAQDLKNAGFTATELTQAGYSPQELKAVGFTAGELKNAGVTAKDLATLGYTPQELQQAGLTNEELTTVGVSGVATDNVSSKDCSVFRLYQLHKNGVSAAKLKEVGCGVAALRAAGYTASELKAAGFTAKELKDAGFTAQNLKDAGFSAGELHQAGFSAKELKDAGFTASNLKEAGFSASDLQQAGYTPQELQEVGYSSGELVRAGLEVPKPQEAVPTQASSIAPMPSTGNAHTELRTQLAELRQQQMQQLSAQELKEKVNQMQTTMATQANDLFAAWTPLPVQQFVQGAEVVTASHSDASNPEGTQEVTQAGTIYKAGTILFAVLDTGINSDETSPIMATIIQGDLQGSKVLGTFQRVNKKVVLQFTVLNVPKLNKSIAVNGVAIDPNTARTALASHVDSHYMLRYGTLFAASFVSGLGQAVQTSGSSSTTSDAGQQQHFWPKLNPAQTGLAALGTVGQQFANKLSPVFDTPPTVEVKAGSGLGLLLMSDLSVPKEEIKQD